MPELYETLEIFTKVNKILTIVKDSNFSLEKKTMLFSVN